MKKIFKNFTTLIMLGMPLTIAASCTTNAKQNDKQTNPEQPNPKKETPITPKENEQPIKPTPTPSTPNEGNLDNSNKEMSDTKPMDKKDQDKPNESGEKKQITLNKFFPFLDRNVYQEGKIVYRTTDKIIKHNLSKKEAIEIVDKWLNEPVIYDEQTGAKETHKKMFNIKYSELTKREE